MFTARLLLTTALISFAGVAMAKFPPLTDEAKARAAEATARTAWSDKVAGYQLCKAQDRVATKYVAEAKAKAKEVKPAAATPPCADPGPFAYTPPAPQRPLEAAGAHSPPATAATPPNTAATQSQISGGAKK